MDKPQDNYELLDYVLAHMPPLPDRDLEIIRVDARSGEPESGLSWALSAYASRGDKMPEKLKYLIEDMIEIDGWESNCYATMSALSHLGHLRS